MLPFAASASADDLLRALLDVSLTGLIAFRPVASPTDPATIIDLAYVYLNPAAQRMLRLPECPPESFLTLYPSAVETGIFAFYRDTFLAGEPGRYNVNYQAEGLDNYFHLAGRRAGDLLLVSFTDTADQPRSAVEQALRESQARERALLAAAQQERAMLQTVVTQAPAGICLFQGPAHVITLANDRVCAMWGYPPAQVLGQPLLVGVPELRGQGFAELLDEVARTGQAYSGTEVPAQLLRDGQLQTHYYNFVYQPVYDAAGALLGIFDLVVEITEQVVARQQVEQLNQELEARVQARTLELQAQQAQVLAAARQQVREREAFHAVFEQTPALIALLRDPGHRFEYVNPAYQALFPGRQLVGLDMAAAVPETRDQGFVALLDKVYQTGETFFGAELPFTTAPAAGQTGRVVYFNFTYQAYREGGQVAGISIFAYDVTEQVLARQQREAERQQLQAVFAQAPVPIFVAHGPAHVLQVVNPAMSELLGQPVPDLLGQPFAEAIPGIAAQGYPDLLDRVWRTGQPIIEQESPARLVHHRPGEVGYFNFVYQPVFDSAGRVSDIMCVAVDVSAQVLARRQVQDLNEELAAINEELHAANEELSDTNQQLTRTNVDLDNFIYTASHDLKAPISNIEGLLYLLQQELPAELTHQEGVGPTLSHMLDAVERFKRTIDHLTEVSKLQKEHAPATSMVNLAAIIEDVRQDLLPQLQAAGARLVVEVAALPAVQFAEKNLRSIVYNLLSNALKYRHPDRAPHIDVRAHMRRGRPVLEVHDNGLGLAPAHLPRLFTMFQRFHDHVEGTGIGLYMVKRMVENAGGHLEVHSQLGAGTTFFVFLPPAAGPQPVR